MYVEMKALNFQYKNAKEEAIKDFSMNIEKGEIIAILGESGSGKSTVLRLISGLEVPKCGFIQIDQRTMVDQHTFILPEKRGVGMVFQDYALFPHMTVEKNIEFGLKGMGRKEKNQKVREVLALVDMEKFHKRYPYELSGGQQQRIALARTLAPNPSLVLLDEPFSNLDKDLQIRIREELKEIIKSTQITSIFVTHDKEDAKAIADRVVILKEGKIIQVGNPKELLNKKI
ncbi:MAG: ABC transporter ATP-binding protein [Marinisporobacter sp.]|jgi:iron(III) transport system ATP-binding protein|nr:ABC transporter ATP-binding protein [Marinisporobacter sp.]